MPKYPHTAERVKELTGSVYEKYRHLIKQQTSVAKLHIGDTALWPPYAMPLADYFTSAHRDMTKYCNTYGVDELRKTIAEKVSEDNGINSTRDHVLVTAGASNALSAAMMTLINPGDEVIVLTPCWPFFTGMVRATGGKVVEVPLYMDLYDQPEMDIFGKLKNATTSKTVAVYVNSPNNPSGKMLDAQQWQAVVDFVKQHQLWLISDEAYDGLAFDGRKTISPATLGIREQTISIFTFSKIFMFAGLRLGYAIAEPELIHALNKVMVHQLYSPSPVGQYMMVEPLRRRHEWMHGINAQYQKLRDAMVEALGMPVAKPEGTYFVFLDAAPYLQGRTFDQLVEQMIMGGVLVAPGGDFGKNFSSYIRLCFTGEPESIITSSAQVIRNVLLQNGQTS